MQSEFSDLEQNTSQSDFSKSLVFCPFSLVKNVERLHKNVLPDYRVHTPQCVVIHYDSHETIANNVSIMQHYTNGHYIFGNLKVGTSPSGSRSLYRYIFLDATEVT